MEKIYITPCTEIYKVQITNHLLIGSDEKSVEIDTGGTPIDIDEETNAALGRQQDNCGNIWDNIW